MEAIKLGVGIIFLTIGLILGITAWMNQAPTIAGLTNTATGTTLANAGITRNTLAGVTYSFINVFWALVVLVLSGVVAIAYVMKQTGKF